MLGKVSTKIKNGGVFSVVNWREKERFEVGKSLYGLEFSPFNAKNKAVIKDNTPIKKIDYVFGNVCIAETKKAIYIVRNDFVIRFSDNHYFVKTDRVPKCGQRIVPKKTIDKNCYGKEKGPYDTTDIIKKCKKIASGVFLAESDESKYLVIVE